MARGKLATTPVELRNRIKELRYVDTADVCEHPGNWRDHPEAQAAAMAGVLREVGIADALIAYESPRNAGKLTLIDGHLRAGSHPGKWPVLVLDVSDAEADYLLLTLDPLAGMAQAGKEALDALMSTVNSGEAAVQQMLTTLAARSGLYIDDPAAEWKGMPEFEQKDTMAYRTILVHFADEEAVQDFARVVSQRLTSETKFIWHPAQHPQPRGEYATTDES